MLTCIFAMALNAFVVLTCDCTKCHTRVVHACNCGECIHAEGDLFFSQHCDCTHTHENTIRTGLTVESERVLKLMKIVVAELPRSLVCSVDITAVTAHDVPMAVWSVPLSDDPSISTGGLRAPPVCA